MKLRFLFGVIPLVVTWPSMLGQVPVKNPLQKKEPSRPGAAYLTAFDAKRLTTLEGTVTRVFTVPSTQVWLTNVQLLVHTKDGDRQVSVGPSWFIEHQELTLAPNDAVRVTGSQVKQNGIETVIATEVRRGDQVLTLRDAEGVPVWAAWRWPVKTAATQ